MGWGSSNQGGADRFVPVGPPDAYRVLLIAVQRGFRLRGADDILLTVNFSSGASAFTWGENFSAQVVPAEGGSTIHVQGVGKVGRQIQQNARIAKLLVQLFVDFGAALRVERGDAVPPPVQPPGPFG